MLENDNLLIKVDKQQGLIQISEQFYYMQVKGRDGGPKQKYLCIFPNGTSMRHTGVFKHKILPSLNKFTNPQTINFQIYEQLKEERKLELFRPKNEVNLFLEGEVAFSANTNRNHVVNETKIIDMTSLPRCRRKPQITIKTIFHNKAVLKMQKSDSETIKAEDVNNSELIKHRSPPKQAPLYSTNCTIENRSNASTTKRQADKINRSVRNIMKIQEVNNSKVAVYLQKKQLDQIKAESFIITEYPSMRIITGNRYKNNGEIASLTKIMTFYSVLKLSTEKKIDIANTIITVDEEASEMTGTSAELVVGDLLSVEQLLYGLMLPSGNDAAMALAKWAGDLFNSHSSDACPMTGFVTLMNKHAKELGMKQSSFGNPHGLPNLKNTSNPFDLSILIGACLKMPLFRKIVGTQNYNIWITNEGASKELVWQNTNKLLRRQGFIGVKTGVTVTAGPCLATCFEHNDKNFIIVLLRTSKLSRRFKETRLILGWTLKKYDNERYHQVVKKILKNDVALDSDNSEDEEEFKYQKVDATEMAKRNKILVYEL